MFNALTAENILKSIYPADESVVTRAGRQNAENIIEKCIRKRKFNQVDLKCFKPLFTDCLPVWELKKSVNNEIKFVSLKESVKILIPDRRYAAI